MSDIQENASQFTLYPTIEEFSDFYGFIGSEIVQQTGIFSSQKFRTLTYNQIFINTGLKFGVVKIVPPINLSKFNEKDYFNQNQAMNCNLQVFEKRGDGAYVIKNEKLLCTWADLKKVGQKDVSGDVENTYWQALADGCKTLYAGDFKTKIISLKFNILLNMKKLSWSRRFIHGRKQLEHE